MYENFDIGHDLKTAFEDGYRAGVEAAQPKWISVEERLPDKQCEYLVRYGFGEESASRFSGVMYFVLYDERPHFENDGLYGLNVTHWMPLPSTEGLE